MSKGNQLAPVSMSKTKVPDADDFFSKAAAPLKDIVSWNNKLDSMLHAFRSIGSDIKRANSKTPSPVIGVPELKLSDDALSVSVIVKKDGAEVPAKSLDKVTKECVHLVETKAKLLHKRVVGLKKKPNLDHVKFKLDKGMVKLDIDKKWEEEYADDDAFADMQRSLTKFNDRYGLLEDQLRGPVTLHETIVALIADVKKKLKEMGSDLGVKIGDNGIPELTGIPESIEDVLPSLPSRGWKLFNDLIAYIKNLMEQVPGVQTKIEALIEESKELQSKLKDMMSNAGLGMGDAFKAAKAVKKNISLLVGAPKMITTLTNTMQQALLSISGALTGKADSAPGAAPKAAGGGGAGGRQSTGGGDDASSGGDGGAGDNDADAAGGDGGDAAAAGDAPADSGAAADAGGDQ